MRVILGLGNPGSEYEDTRHNAGFLLADRLVRHWAFGRFRRRGPARVVDGKRGGVSIQILKPETFMNRSGSALVPLADNPHFDPDQNLLVLVDDVDLELGRFRLRASGSAGGHNGLRSIEEVLGSQQYARLRIGVGPRPFASGELADYVLDRFTPAEREILDATLDPMAEAVECWLDEGIELAMSRFNRRQPPSSLAP